MALSKQEFAELIEKAIEECKHIVSQSKKVTEKLYMENDSQQPIEENPEYKYNKYMERLAVSKMTKLFAVLANPAYDRIMSMSHEEIEAYRVEKISEITIEVNRLVLDFGGTRTDMDRLLNKEKVELLLNEQRKLKDMDVSEFKKYMISKLSLGDAKEGEYVVSATGEEETVLANISKNKETLSKFFNLIREYRTLEKEISTIKEEQAIIYKDLLPGNLTLDYLSDNVEELFSDEGLSKLQSALTEYLQNIVDANARLEIDFSEETKNAYLDIKSTNYKYIDTNKGGKLPYDQNGLNILRAKMSAKQYELALIQNMEWQVLSKKLFKSFEIKTRIGQLSIEIDETKSEIDASVRDWYKTNYFDNPAFEPVSGRTASGMFFYSVGAKVCLSELVSYGIWPDKEEIESFGLALKVHKAETEKSIIRAEQIKEKFTRLYTGTLEEKKKKQENVEKQLTKLVGDWKNPVILSIIDGVKENAKPCIENKQEEEVASKVGEYSANKLVTDLVVPTEEVLEIEEKKK